MNDSQNLEHPTVVLIRGLPGSGKTYFATELQKALGANRVAMLDPDETDYKSVEYQEHTKALTTEGVEEKLHPYRFLRAKAYKGIEDNKIIIWNQPFTNLEIFNKMVGRLKDHASEYDKQMPILVVEVEVDQATAKARVDERKNVGGHGPSHGTFARFIDDYKSFASEGYNTVKIQGSDNLSASVPSVMKALEQLL